LLQVPLLENDNGLCYLLDGNTCWTSAFWMNTTR
jgi:hypothetical protein